MAAQLSRYLKHGQMIGIRRPTCADGDEFVALATCSRKFLQPWIDPPATHERFENYLLSRQTPTDDGVLICELASGRIAGVVNLNCIVRRYFQSAYLGYWIGAPFAGRGYMTEAMKLVITLAFNELRLHRLEANIQPANLRSIALVRRCGFEKEGFSPKYLQVSGEWRDHERWAIRTD